LAGDGEARAALGRACAEVGAFELRLDDEASARLQATLSAARAFFALPAAAKRALDIAHSRHHRGYSEMHNERDWREQLHLGAERPPAKSTPADGAPEWAWLTGPNQWPSQLGGTDFRAALLAHQDEMAALGRQLLAALALPTDDGDAYLVTKLINYLPQPLAQPLAQPLPQLLAQPLAQPSAQFVVQPSAQPLSRRAGQSVAAAAPARSGVAAHVDYSLVTLLAQDDVGGLELQTRDGMWRAVRPRPGTLVVNLGELAEAASGGLLRATPHRVTNAACDRSRLSIPVFVNPPLDAIVTVPAAPPAPLGLQVPRDPPAAHVHRVLPDGAAASFHYGAAEWRRKGHNLWCHHCCGSRDPAP
jgi:isopenicillin N synthase-like dioxygenase